MLDPVIDPGPIPYIPSIHAITPKPRLQARFI